MCNIPEQDLDCTCVGIMIHLLEPAVLGTEILIDKFYEHRVRPRVTCCREMSWFDMWY